MLRKFAVIVTATLTMGLLSGTAASAREIVGAPSGYSPGTIVVKTNERRLIM